MSISIRTNVASLNAQNNLSSTQNQLNKALAQLSSGYRITSASDDAAGLAISSNLESQIQSYGQAVRNANDGLSIVQTAEAAFNESTNIVTRLKELATQSASDTVSDTDRGYIDTEAQQLVGELDRISKVTEFNGTYLLDGSKASLSVQVGVHNTADDSITLTLNKGDSSTLFGGKTIALDKQGTAATALDTLDAALGVIATNRASLGATGNQLQSAVNSIQSFSESLSAADSRIKDVDVAQATSDMSRANVLAQAGVSVLAQANQMPQMALKLLQ